MIQLNFARGDLLARLKPRARKRKPTEVQTCRAKRVEHEEAKARVSRHLTSDLKTIFVDPAGDVAHQPEVIALRAANFTHTRKRIVVR